MFRALIAALLLLPAAPLQADDTRAADGSARDRLHALFAEQWERGLRENPVGASMRGDRRWNDQWGDRSLAAIEASQAADQAALERLKAIERSALDETDRVSYDMYLRQLELGIEGDRFRGYLIPLNQRGGVQTLDGVTESLRFETVKDYEDWIARLRGIDTVIEQTTALMRLGIEEGRVPPKVTMGRVPAQIAKQLVDDPTRSRFYAPLLTMPESIDEATRERLSMDARKAIDEVVLPAYRRFQTFFVDEYLPACRESIAARDLPDGEAFYAHLARRFTTTEKTPEQIHAIGLAEVMRIRAEMEQVRQQVGFDGELPAFFEHLRTDPKFFEKTPEALFDAYLAVSKRIDPELVKVFHVRTIPRMPYGLRPIPDNVAPDTTTAYYSRGADDGSRAGYYYVNLYRPEVRPKWEMMALSIHEAVPGHHLQISRAQELGDLPEFRRSAGITAYTEGWGLYSERLGHEMGLYSDPYDHFGQLTYDMWRAVRLVVDTGMHHKGWSRQQAIDYFMANAPKTEQDIVNEIDRYIAWPGQALAYKIGQLEILKLRKEAEEKLGKDFDIRAFHDHILEEGSIPLSTLRSRMQNWIAAQSKKKT